MSGRYGTQEGKLTEIERTERLKVWSLFEKEEKDDDEEGNEDGDDDGE